MSKIKLVDLVDIRWGYNAHSKELFNESDINNKDNYALYIRSGNREIIDNKIIKTSYLKLNRKIKLHLITESDVLLYKDGKNPYALTYRNKIGNVIASHSFLILCTFNNKNVINPDYLSYYLNNYTLKNYKLNNKNIKDVIIYLPNIEQQLLIVNIYKNFKINEKINRYNTTRLINNILDNNLIESDLEKLKFIYNE